MIGKTRPPAPARDSRLYANTCCCHARTGSERWTARCAGVLGEAVFADVLENVPDDWLRPEPGIPGASYKRAAYVDYLMRRLDAAGLFVEEAIRAPDALV